MVSISTYHHVVFPLICTFAIETGDVLLVATGVFLFLVNSMHVHHWFMLVLVHLGAYDGEVLSIHGGLRCNRVEEYDIYLN